MDINILAREARSKKVLIRPVSSSTIGKKLASIISDSEYTNYITMLANYTRKVVDTSVNVVIPLMKTIDEDVNDQNETRVDNTTSNAITVNKLHVDFDVFVSTFDLKVPDDNNLLHKQFSQSGAYTSMSFNQLEDVLTTLKEKLSSPDQVRTSIDILDGISDKTFMLALSLLRVNKSPIIVNSIDVITAYKLAIILIKYMTLTETDNILIKDLDNNLGISKYYQHITDKLTRYMAFIQKQYEITYELGNIVSNINRTEPFTITVHSKLAKENIGNGISVNSIYGAVVKYIDTPTVYTIKVSDIIENKISYESKWNDYMKAINVTTTDSIRNHRIRQYKDVLTKHITNHANSLPFEQEALDKVIEKVYDEDTVSPALSMLLTYITNISTTNEQNFYKDMETYINDIYMYSTTYNMDDFSMCSRLAITKLVASIVIETNLTFTSDDGV